MTTVFFGLGQQPVSRSRGVPSPQPVPAAGSSGTAILSTFWLAPQSAGHREVRPYPPSLTPRGSLRHSVPRYAGYASPSPTHRGLARVALRSFRNMAEDPAAALSLIGTEATAPLPDFELDLAGAFGFR